METVTVRYRAGGQVREVMKGFYEEHRSELELIEIVDTVDGPDYVVMSEEISAKDKEINALKLRAAELEAQILALNATPEPPPQEMQEIPKDEVRDQMKAQLDALGVEYHHANSIQTLQAKLDEALA